jgi:TatD family-associated radical SAM protein
MSSVNNLWLEQEPTVAEAIADFELQDWSLIREVVFCGFGEPTMRLDDLLELMRYVKTKDPMMKTRLNTNGLSDLEYGRETAPLFAGLLDTISISLNASTPQQYLQLTRNRFGEVSYPGMLDFAVKAKQYVPNVVMTVVDNIGAAEIAACREICADRGLVLRVRPYEAN